MEEGGGAGGCEAGGYYWCYKGVGGVDGVDMFDTGFRSRQCGLGGFIAVVVWTCVFAVHADAADEGSLAFLETDVCEDVCACGVDCRVVCCCCCSCLEGALDAGVVDFFCFGRGGERGFEGVGVFV